MNTLRLGDLTEKIGSGATPLGGSSVYQSHGVALIRSQNVHNDGFHRGGLAFINERHASELNNVVVTRDDVLLNITGDSVARVCQVPDDILPARVNQHVAIIRPQRDRLDARFLRYYLTSPAMQDYMLAMAAAGATRDALTKSMIENFEVPNLEISKQLLIAHVLGTLDDKIELNRRINETLEAMSQALFSVLFGERKPNGVTSDGKIGPFEQLATLSRETINPREFQDEIFDHYSIPAFDEGRLPKAEAGEQIKSNKFVVPADAVMISKLNPRISRVWLPKVSETRRSVSSTEFLLAIPKVGISPEYIYGLFNSSAFLDVFATMVTGTSSSHQRVKAEYLLAMDVTIASPERIGEYTKQAKPLHDRVSHNLVESRTLAALRDALLPELLNGRVVIKG